ncbi:hypothetical protein E4U42_002962 [Claviceps africana]|uniref:Uncharacterized protein n=1 Tax=Claviceps africana TaxID=83212 RepID=A0A8K0JDI2_9HYPO|nr:hypothetical protein E4U42_002962 [Claviceps africana]
MHFTALVLAILPALSLADSDAGNAKRIKTVKLSLVHPHTSTVAPVTTTTSPMTSTSTGISNSTSISISTSTRSCNTTMYMPTGTGGMTSVTSSVPDTTTPAVVPTHSGPGNAAGALDATNIAFAGLVGMLAAAMM